MGDQHVVFAFFTTPKHRFLRLIHNVGTPSRENSRLSKSLEIEVEMFSGIKALALSFRAILNSYH